jgi:cytidylate kinase
MTSGAPLIVAIDGPAGTGKSTVAKSVAERAGLPYLDTGAMYRSVAWACRARHVDIESASAVAAVARTVRIELPSDGRVVVDGHDATAEIRTPEISQMASKVATVPDVRTTLVEIQRRLINAGNGGVAEGRDIGTVVFPDAPVKVFLTASPLVRAERRFAESEGITLDELARQIALRDERDQTRADSPLRPADGAAVIDTTDRTIDEVVTMVMELIARGREDSSGN